MTQRTRCARALWQAGFVALLLGATMFSMGQNCSNPKLDLVSALVMNSIVTNTEQLGDPQGLVVAPGTDILAAGTGLLTQPGTINLTVPDGLTVVQVILYWEGQAATETEQGDTDTITLNGTISVTGDRIGGPTGFLSDYWTSTYRADITQLNLITTGANSISVEGLDFGQRNNGAGILVIVDEANNGTIAADLQIKDGNDFFFRDFAPPLDTTGPVTFNFAPSTEERTAYLNLFFTSAALEDVGVGRPSVIEISVDGVLVDSLVDVLANSDGDEWDTVRHTVTIPAGATSLTVQALSEDAGTGQFAGRLPVSSTWVAASFAILPPLEEEGEGCTPGYWKQSQHFGNWTAPYDPSDLFSSVFDDAFPGKTLLQVLEQGGGGLNALGRHTVAALLNAASPDVDYGLTAQEVIDAFNAVYPGGDYEDLKDEFEDLNESYCPLGRAPLPDNFDDASNRNGGKKAGKK